MSSLVYLLVWSPPPHIPYISSPNQCLLFATDAHTIATCFAVAYKNCNKSYFVKGSGYKTYRWLYQCTNNILVAEMKPYTNTYLATSALNWTSSRWALVSLFPLSFLPLLVLEKNFEVSFTGFEWAGCPSCHPTDDVEALKETESMDPYQCHHHLLIYLWIMRKGVYIPLCRLSDATTAYCHDTLMSLPNSQNAFPL